ncbi:hypothetical protein A2U01_0114966, partial [Trifolium medium]|nr:hypothetical protein [Trifolium medium]
MSCAHQKEEADATGGEELRWRRRGKSKEGNV